MCRPEGLMTDATVPCAPPAAVYLGVRGEDGSWEVSAYAKNIFNTFRVLDRATTAAAIRVNG